MSDTEFDIIFRGDIVIGQQLADVKARLQQLFKADAARIEQLFSGRPVPVKRKISAAEAEKYRAVLLKAGARVDVRPSSAQASPGSSLTLAPVGVLLLRPSERQTVEAVDIDTDAISLRPQEGDLLDATEKKPQAEWLLDIPDFGLAPVGESLLRTDERQAVAEPVVAIANWEVIVPESAPLTSENN